MTVKLIRIFLYLVIISLAVFGICITPLDSYHDYIPIGGYSIAFIASTFGIIIEFTEKEEPIKPYKRRIKPYKQ